MDKKVTDKIDETGHKVNDWVEAKSAKHGFTKFQVWVGLAVGVLAIIGAVKLLGWL